jgi:uncharacterized protein YigE (DUF2233 family)
MIRLLLLMCCLSGCMLAVGPPPTPTPTPTPAPEGWQVLAYGLEQRAYRPGSNILGQIQVLRVDPTQYTFRAHYQPGAPLTLRQWQAVLPDAVAFVNANFFSPDHTILGLLVADGQVYGQSYQGRGGTFVVQNGVPRVRSNTLEPYAGESLEQAVQAFPMLVENGQAVYTGDSRVARRTAIAQDAQGRILLMVTPLTGLTLDALSAYLPATDLQIVQAFNLDGGGSTLMHVQVPGGSPLQLTSFDPVPAVLAVYPR